MVSAGLIGGTVGGKAGVTHFHVGPGKARLRLLRTLLDEHDIPMDHLYPTHVERTPALMDEAITLARRGAYVDIDVLEEDLARWLKYYREHDGPLDQLTASSDGHASSGDYKLYAQVVACVRDHKLPLETVLPHVTRNTARVLQLPGKGGLAVDQDADVLIMDAQTLEIAHLFARGRPMIRDGQVVAETG
jgi:beta-aspartyl-dipeptidase (metallo-type)